MAVPIFGVTAAKVRAHFFPQMDSEFSTSSNPTATTVGEMIDAEGARLAGALLAEGVTAATLSADAGVTYPAAYNWCADTIRIGAAARAMQAMTGQSPDAVDDMVKRLEARYTLLAEGGSVVLGDAASPSEESNGPRTHIGNHNLDTGDETLISDVVPSFRRSDVL